MYLNEFAELIVTAKGQFAECNIFEILNEFFIDARDVWNGEIRRPWVFFFLFIFIFRYRSLLRKNKGMGFLRSIRQDILCALLYPPPVVHYIIWQISYTRF